MIDMLYIHESRICCSFYMATLKKTSQDRTAQLAVFRVVPLVPQEDAELGAREFA